jgi:hypothetical protein
MRLLNLVIMLLVLALLSVGCADLAPTSQMMGSSVDKTTSDAETTSISSAEKAAAPSVEKVEVIHFHGTHQCYSCKTVGQYADDTVNSLFADEVKNGKVSFAHINTDLLENMELVKKYGVTGSSLWIGVYDNNGFHKEENVNVWYKIDNKEEYVKYLSEIIAKRLKGDLN